MKLRIKWNGQRRLLVLGDEHVITFRCLVDAVSKACGVDRRQCYVTLNGRDVLQCDDDNCDITELGIRSGDLLTVLAGTEGTTGVRMPGSIPASCLNATRPEEVRQAAWLENLKMAASTTSVVQGTPNNEAAVQTQFVHSESSPMEVVQSPVSGVDPPPEASINDEIQIVSGTCCKAEIEELDSAGAIVPAEGSGVVDVVWQPTGTCDMLLGSTNEETPALKKKCNVNEPFLVCEASESCLPSSLAMALQCVDCLATASPADLIFVAMHTLMVESGYQQKAADKDGSVATAMPSSWKSKCGYKVAYSHEKIGPDTIINVIAILMGNNSLVVRACSDHGQTLVSLQLSPKDYVRNVCSDPLKLFKNLARLSRLFKDCFSHRLLPSDLVCLPSELSLVLLAYLDVPATLAIGATCKAMRELCRDAALWRRHYFARYGHITDAAVDCDWYRLYKEKYLDEKRRREAVARMRSDEYMPWPLHREYFVPPPDPLIWPPRGGGIVGGDYDLLPGGGGLVPRRPEDILRVSGHIAPYVVGRVPPPRRLTGGKAVPWLP